MSGKIRRELAQQFDKHLAKGEFVEASAWGQRQKGSQAGVRDTLRAHVGDYLRQHGELPLPNLDLIFATRTARVGHAAVQATVKN